MLVAIGPTLMNPDEAIASTMPGFGQSGDEGFVASFENPRVLTWVKAENLQTARRAQF
jgi:hypothetical protein